MNEITITKAWLEGLLKESEKVEKSLDSMLNSPYSELYATRLVERLVEISSLIGYISSIKHLINKHETDN